MRAFSSVLILTSAIALTGCVVATPERRPPPPVEYGRSPPPPEYDHRSRPHDDHEYRRSEHQNRDHDRRDNDRDHHRPSEY